MLEGKNFVYLATVNPDGTPQVTPTWVDTDGKFVLVNTAIGRVKHRNVKKNPNVALAITDQNNPYNLVVIRGKVVDQLTGHVWILLDIAMFNSANGSVDEYELTVRVDPCGSHLRGPV